MSENDVAAMTFEEIVDELERTARAMEAADLGIEQAAELYERAGLLHRVATQRLASVQIRLEELRGAVPRDERASSSSEIHR